LVVGLAAFVIAFLAGFLAEPGSAARQSHQARAAFSMPFRAASASVGRRFLRTGSTHGPFPLDRM